MCLLGHRSLRKHSLYYVCTGPARHGGTMYPLSLHHISNRIASLAAPSSLGVSARGEKERERERECFALPILMVSVRIGRGRDQHSPLRRHWA